MRRTILSVLTTSLLVSAGLASAQTAPFPVADMLDIVEFVRGSEPVVSSGGDLVAYSTVGVGDDANVRAMRPTGHLFVVPASGGAARRVTAPEERGEAPSWAQGARRLLFVLERGRVAQLAIWDAETARTRTVGPSLGADREHLPLGSLAPQWTPDARAIVVPIPEPRPAAEEKPRVRVVRSTDVIVPGDARFTDTRRWRLTLVDAASGAARALTPEPIALRSFHIAPDGNHVLFRAVVPETLGRFRKEETRYWVAPLTRVSAPRLVLQDRRPSWVTFSPRPAQGGELIYSEGRSISSLTLADDATRVIARGLPDRTEDPLPAPGGSRIAVLAARPGTGPGDSGMYSILRSTQDLLVVDVVSGETRFVTDRAREDEISDLTWSRSGRTLFYRAVDPVSYRESIVRWDSDAAAPRALLEVDEALGALSVSSDAARVAFIAMSPTRPADGWTMDGSGQGRTRLTDLNPQLQRAAFVAPTMFDFYSADGDPLRGLLYAPPGAGPGRRVPVVTYVYEKLTPQKNRFNAEAQLHAAHGYAYLMPDVLVKPGYTGESFVKCVVPAVDAVRRMGFTNGRFGVTGGSFGGYAGLFLITRVDVFAGAVVRAPPSEFFSTWGDGRDRDIWTIETGQARTGGPPWEVPERYLANSPFFHADRVRTPVLIMHGEKDFTVPLQQSEMMFYALRALGRTAELVLYREGDHGIVRGSRVDFIDFYTRMLGWWEKCLQPRSTDSNARP